MQAQNERLMGENANLSQILACCLRRLPERQLLEFGFPCGDFVTEGNVKILIHRKGLPFGRYDFKMGGAQTRRTVKGVRTQEIPLLESRNGEYSEASRNLEQLPRMDGKKNRNNSSSHYEPCHRKSASTSSLSYPTVDVSMTLTERVTPGCEYDYSSKLINEYRIEDTVAVCNEDIAIDSLPCLEDLYRYAPLDSPIRE